jgi:electron transfer flavoprotein alpha subunit
VSGILLFAFAADDELSQQALAFATALGGGDVDVVTVEGPYAPAAWGAALAEVVREHSPPAVLAPGSDRGNELLAHVGALLDLPMAANCIAATLEHPASVTRVRWGGSLLEEARVHGTPLLATVAAHAVAAEPFPAPPRPLPVAQDTPVRVLRRLEPASGGISLTDAPVVVSGGRGVGSAEGFAVVEELASLLGGAVGCSRAVTSAGWRPHSDQVGQTGTKVSPDLYIACGISGATQHMAGCKGAKKLLAINADGEASIFASADYGVIGDLHEVLPAVCAEIRKARGA